MINFGEFFAPIKSQRESSYKLSLSQNKLPRISPLNRIKEEDHYGSSNNNIPTSSSSILDRPLATSSLLEYNNSGKFLDTAIAKSNSINVLFDSYEEVIAKTNLKQKKKCFIKNHKPGPVPNIKVKKLLEIQNTTSKYLGNMEEDIVELSSDSDENAFRAKDNIPELKDFQILKPTKKKAIITKRKCNRIEVDKNKNCIQCPHSNHLLKKKSTKCSAQKHNIKTLMKEKIIIKRNITKSTNLKSFPAKYLPKNQSKIDNFFKVVSDSNKIKYFETFPISEACKFTENYVGDYLEIVMENLEQMKTSNKLEVTDDNIILMGTDEEGSDRFFEIKSKGNASQYQKISNKEDTIIGENIKNESIYKYFSVCKTRCKNSNSLEETDLMKICNSNTFKEKNEEPSISKMRDKNLIKINSESDSSSIIFLYDKVTFGEAESVDYTPTNVQTEIEESPPMCSTSTLPDSNNRIMKKNKCKIQQKGENNVISKYIQNINEIQAKNNFGKRDFELRRGTKDRHKIKSMTKRKKQPVSCPEYKIIEGTTFAVDAFRFGNIEGVTHYFLTHFHADHYIGLRKDFKKPIFLSENTAKLVKAFIYIRPEYLHVMQNNQPVLIKDIEVTALDANHCPGAVMFLFKFPNGMCTLHTGDFRACPEMEMEPAFWNNTIYTIYLDTTYLSNKYNFKSQWESIYDAVRSVNKFRLEHIGEKILYVCGSYVIGKEKIWQALAERYKFKVWTDGNRRRALEVIGDKSLLKFLVDDPTSADIHILTMGQLSYDYLSEYLKKFSDYFDIIFAIRPSGWEKNSKPQSRGQIHIIGIEYSEHSSHDELRRFVRFLQPRRIISTVPRSNDISKPNKIPPSWFHNEIRPLQKGYQQSITNFLKVTGSSVKKKNSALYSHISSDLESGFGDVSILNAQSVLREKCEENISIESNDSLRSDWMS